MAGEWKRASWAYSPISLSHTPSHIVKAFESFLTQSGWERSSWSGSADDRHFLRADRFMVRLANDVVGTAGNQTTTKTGANITVSGMAGGSGGAAATGYIQLTGQPADGNTVVLNDGVNAAVTFEFDSNASVTETGTLRQVVIGSSVDATLDNLEAAINSAAYTLAITGTIPRRWRYDGDSLTQHCGIHVRYVSASSRVEVSAFLENTAKSAMQVETLSATMAFITYDNTAVNDYIIYGGEDGLYCEVGRGGTSQNIAHFMVATMAAVPEFSGTKDNTVRWTSQGFVCDLFGNLKFAEDRNNRFVDNQGSNKNYTSSLKPGTARGTTSLLVSTPVNNQAYYLCNRDNMYGIAWTASSLLTWSMITATFGMGFTPVDGRYKLSPMMLLQGFNQSFLAGVNSASAATNVAASGANATMLEPRWFRVVPRLYAADAALLPFNNITDQVTGKVLRVAQIADGGRTCNLGVEYPDGSNIVTIPATPTV